MAGPSGDLPLRPREMRDRNRALVLDAVVRSEPVTRAQLAARTGLTKSSVSSIVQELRSAGLVVEQGAQRGGDLGRPGTALTLARDGLAGLGLEVNVDYLAAWATDLAGVLHHRAFVASDNRAQSPEEVIGELAHLSVGALAQPFAETRTPLSACVAVPGLVDSHGGLVVAPNLGWADVPVADLLREALEDPSFELCVENEANLGAVAELVEGAGRGLRDFVYVSGEIGIGA